MKSLKLLIVANRSKWSSWPSKVQELKNWFSPKIDFQIDIVHTNYTDIKFQTKDYTNSIQNAVGVDYEWYNKHVTSMALAYDIVLFVIPMDQWPITNRARGWRTDNDEGPVELQVSADENEIRIFPDGKQSGTFYDFTRHEIMHALFMLTGQKDTTHFWWDKGALEKALEEVVFPQPRISDEINRWEKILAFIRRLIASGDIVLPKSETPTQPKPALLNKFCMAIQKFEDYVPPGGKYRDGTIAKIGSLSWRNKNPGNIRYIGQSRAIGKDKNNFCIFKTYEDGYAELREMVIRAATGKSKVYKPTMTILDYFNTYAPTSDGNFPRAYAKFVASEIGVDVNFVIGNLI